MFKVLRPVNPLHCKNLGANLKFQVLIILRGSFNLLEIVFLEENFPENFFFSQALLPPT